MKQQINLSAGLKFMAYSAFWFSVMSMLVKLAGRNIPSQQIVLIRSVLSFLFTAIAIHRAGIPFFGNDKKWLFLRGLFGFIALSCVYYGLTKLPLAEAVVIQYTNPVFTAILAAIFLKEGFSRAVILGSALSLLGVMFITRPASIFGSVAASLDTFAVLIALLGAVLSAVAYTIVRKLTTTEHNLTIILYFPMISIPGALPASIENYVAPNLNIWLILLGVGISAQIAQIYLTRGLKMEKAGRATAISYLQFIFALGWGFLIFNEVPGLWSAAGGLCILAGTVLIATKK